MYVMSWSELGAFYTCGGGSIAASDPHGPGGLPGPKEKGLPGNVVKEDPAVWPEASAGARDGPAGAAPGTAAKMGQVSSVARAGDGAAWVLRRGPRAWDAAAFSGADGRTFNHAEPIPDDDSGSLLMKVDQDTGEILQKCGGSKTLPFWMPHMVSPNRDGSVWVTDAGAHTATKLSKDCGTVLLKLGEQGVPGSGEKNFCKPTRAVELGDGGDVLVADGYCNARVARFSKAGVFHGEYDLKAHEAKFPAPGVRVFFPSLFLGVEKYRAAARQRVKKPNFFFLASFSHHCTPSPPFFTTTNHRKTTKNRGPTARTSPTTSPSTSASARSSSPTASTAPSAGLI